MESTTDSAKYFLSRKMEPKLVETSSVRKTCGRTAKAALATKAVQTEAIKREHRNGIIVVCAVLGANLWS